MNLLSLFSRLLVIAGLVVVSNTSAGPIAANRIPLYTGAFLTQDRLTTLFGEEKISPRNQLIIGKALLGATGNLIKDLDRNKRDRTEIFNYNSFGIKTYFQSKDLDEQIAEGKSFCYVQGAGYVVINGTLRVAGDYISLNEKTIDKKCDEVLPENVAWFAKPVARFALDWTYDSATVAILVCILPGL